MNERFNTLIDMQQKLNEAGLVNEDLNKLIFQDILRECELLLKITEKQYKEQLEVLRTERRVAREALEASKPKPVDPEVEARRLESIKARMAAQRPVEPTPVVTSMNANVLGDL